MALVTTGNVRVVNQPEQRVVINGITRPEVECVTISESYGLRANEAMLSLPYRFAGDDVSWLRDAMVMVYVKPSGAPYRLQPDFVGFIDPESARDGADESSVEVLARSALSLLDRVFIGQLQKSAIVEFPQRDRTTGLPTGYRLTSILGALFSPTFLDSNWRSLIGLGSLRAVSRGEFNVPLPDIGFHSTSYSAALRQLMSYVPDVSIREVYLSSGRTMLDFFRFGDPNVGERIVRVPTESQGPEQGAVATAYVQRRSNSGVRTRVIGYGAPAEWMVTLGTDNESGVGLIPAWPNATPYVGEGAPVPHPSMEDGLTLNERLVITEPERSREGSPLFDPALRQHFRVFRIPSSLWEMIARDANVVRQQFPTLSGEESPEIPIQAFREKRVLGSPEAVEGDWIQAASIHETEWELIPGAQLDWKRKLLIFPRPVLMPYGRGYDSVKKTWLEIYARPHVYITLTLFNPRGLRSVWDTGVRGLSFHRFINSSSTGLAYSFVNESCKFQTVGTWPGGSYPAIWFDPSNNQWNRVNAGEGYPARDDRRFLVNLAEKSLRERQQRPIQAEVRLPLYRNAYHVGDTLRVLNRGIDGARLHVIGVDRSLVDPETRIVATDEVPLTVMAERRAPMRSPGMAHGGPGAVGSGGATPEPDYWDILAGSPSADQIMGDGPVPPERNFPMLGQTNQQDMGGEPDLAAIMGEMPEDRKRVLDDMMLAERVPDASPLERRRALARDGSHGRRRLFTPRR